MGLTVGRKTATNLVVRRKIRKILTVSLKKKFFVATICHLESVNISR